MADLTDPNEHEPQSPADETISSAEPEVRSTAFEVATNEAESALAEGAGSRTVASAESGAAPVPPSPVVDKPAARVQNAATKAGETDAKTKPVAGGDSISEIIKTVVYALLIALAIRTFFFQPFNIPSGSMENTLLVGDYLFVEKFSYGYSKYSFLFDFPPFHGRTLGLFGYEPHRGDVAVFRFPPDPSVDFIKRVIGLPGDTVQMINGQLWLNGKAIPKVRVADYVETDEFGGENHVKRYRETLPSGKSYYVLDRMDNGPGDNTQLYTVPAGHYFMMGDNRDNSADSRREVGSVGFVPAENLVGKAEFIFFSAAPDHPIYEFWYWPWEIRYGRMFTLID